MKGFNLLCLLVLVAAEVDPKFRTGGEVRVPLLN